jgi:hypothetical protein
MMDTAQVLLTYYDYLPDRIKIGWDSYRVREFIPDPMRCMKCQQYAGHKAANCRAPQKCPICAGPHAFERCPQAAPDREAERQPRCPNCNGAHSAAYRGCPAFKKAKEIVQIKFTEKISYADAVRQYHHNVAERRQQDAAAARQERAQDPPQPVTEPTIVEPVIPRPAPTQPTTLPTSTQNPPTLDPPLQPKAAQSLPLPPTAPTQPTVTTGTMNPPETPLINRPSAAARARRPTPAAAIHQGLPAILTTPRSAEIQAIAKPNKTKELEEMIARITSIFNDHTDTRSELERLMFTLIKTMYHTLASNNLVN